MLSKLFKRNDKENIPVPPSEGAFNSLTIPEIKSKFAHDINGIYRISGITQKEFEIHFLPVLLKFLFFIQQVPATPYPAYDRLNGLADLTLFALKNSLKLRNGMVLPTGIRADLIDAQKSRWSFVVFSSILLASLRGNINHCMVEVSNGGEFKSWNFSKGALGDFESLRFRKIIFNDPVTDSSVSNFLIQRFVEDKSITWMMEYPNLFIEFMGVLIGNDRQCLTVCDFLSLEKFLPNVKRTDSPDPVKVEVEGSDPDVKKKNKKEKAKKKKNKKKQDPYDYPFFHWLFESLDSGEVELNTNQAKCHIVDGGLFVDIGISKKYAKLSDDPEERKKLEQEVEAQLETHTSVNYSAYGRTIKGFIVTPDLELLSFSPINEDLILDESDDE